MAFHTELDDGFEMESSPWTNMPDTQHPSQSVVEIRLTPSTDTAATASGSSDHVGDPPPPYSQYLENAPATSLQQSSIATEADVTRPPQAHTPGGNGEVQGSADDAQTQVTTLTEAQAPSAEEAQYLTPHSRGDLRSHHRSFCLTTGVVVTAAALGATFGAADRHCKEHTDTGFCALKKPGGSS